MEKPIISEVLRGLAANVVQRLGRMLPKPLTRVRIPAFALTSKIDDPDGRSFIIILRRLTAADAPSGIRLEHPPRRGRIPGHPFPAGVPNGSPGPASDPASQLPEARCRTGRVDAGLLRRFAIQRAGRCTVPPAASRARWCHPGERIRADYGMEATISAPTAQHPWHLADAILDDNVHNYSSVVYKADQSFVGGCTIGCDYPDCVIPSFI